MKRLIKQSISMIVAMAILVTAMPLTAFGLTDGAGSDNTVYDVSPEVNVSVGGGEEAEPTVVCELKDKREPNVKYYRMSNGSITAAVYQENVHYSDENGVMQDIDNRLSDGEDGGEAVYQSGKNSAIVKFMKKSNENKLYTVDKNGYKVKVAIEGVNKTEAVKTEYDYTGAESEYRLDSLTGQVTYYGILPETDYSIPTPRQSSRKT